MASILAGTKDLSHICRKKRSVAYSLMALKAQKFEPLVIIINGFVPALPCIVQLFHQLAVAFFILIETFQNRF